MSTSAASSNPNSSGLSWRSVILWTQSPYPYLGSPFIAAFMALWYISLRTTAVTISIIPGSHSSSLFILPIVSWGGKLTLLVPLQFPNPLSGGSLTLLLCPKLFLPTFDFFPLLLHLRSHTLNCLAAASFVLSPHPLLNLLNPLSHILLTPWRRANAVRHLSY